MCLQGKSCCFSDLWQRYSWDLRITHHAEERFVFRMPGCTSPKCTRIVIEDLMKDAFVHLIEEDETGKVYRLYNKDWRFIVRVDSTNIAKVITCYQVPGKKHKKRYRDTRQREKRKWRKKAQI